MLTQAALRSAPPPTDTLPVSPTPSATVVLLSKIAIDPALNPRTEVDPAIRESIEASMRDRLSRGLHPQESPVWAVAAGPDRWELRAGWTRAAAVAAIVASPPADLPAPSAAWVKAPTLWVSTHAADAHGAALLSLRENLQRAALPLHDVVVACAKIKAASPKLSTAKLATEIGLSDRVLQNMLRVHDTLTPEQWQAYVRRAITQEQAIRLAAVHDADARKAAFLELLEGRPARAKASRPKPTDERDEQCDADHGEHSGRPTFTRVQAEGIARRAMKLSDVTRTVKADQGPSAAMLHAVVDLVLDDSPVAHEAARDRVGKLLAEERTSPKTSKPASPPRPAAKPLVAADKPVKIAAKTTSTKPAKRTKPRRK